MVERERLARAANYPMSSYLPSDHRRMIVDAILADIAAQGFAIVPVEPSERMINAAADTPGMKAASDAMVMHQVRGNRYSAADMAPSPLHQAWSAMIAASEPLGYEFEKVWDDNADKLYEP